MQQQIFYSALDQRLHASCSGATSPNTTDILQETQRQYYGLPFVPNTVNFYALFMHNIYLLCYCLIRHGSTGLVIWWDTEPSIIRICYRVALPHGYGSNTFKKILLAVRTVTDIDTAFWLTAVANRLVRWLPPSSERKLVLQL